MNDTPPTHPSRFDPAQKIPAPAPSNTRPDDLMRIAVMTEMTAHILQHEGYKTFRSIAEMTNEEILRIERQYFMPFLFARQQWITQAGILMNPGGETAYSRWYAREQARKAMV